MAYWYIGYAVPLVNDLLKDERSGLDDDSIQQHLHSVSAENIKAKRGQRKMVVPYTVPRHPR